MVCVVCYVVLCCVVCYVVLYCIVCNVMLCCTWLITFEYSVIIPSYLRTFFTNAFSRCNVFSKREVNSLVSTSCNSTDICSDKRALVIVLMIMVRVGGHIN